MATDNEQLATAIFNTLVETGGDVIDTTYAVIMGSWPGLTIVTLYIIAVGYAVIMGRMGDRSKEWALSALLMTVIGGIAADQGSYSEWIAGPIYDMAFNLAAVGAQSGEGGGVAATFNLMETTIGRTLAIIDNLDVPGNILTNGWLYMKVGAATFVLGLLGVALYLATLALMCIAFFSLFMMLLVGGPCLWLVSFKETRHITWAWLRATANYSLWAFFIGIVASVGVTLTDAAITDLMRWDIARDGVFTKRLGASMLLMALTIYMLLKAADWAAAITGGTSTNTGIIGAMGSMAGGALGGAANALGGAAGGAAKWGGGVLANKTAPGAAAYRAFSAMRGLGQTK